MVYKAVRVESAVFGPSGGSVPLYQGFLPVVLPTSQELTISFENQNLEVSKSNHPIIEMSVPRLKQHRDLAEVVRLSEWWKSGSFAGWLPDTPKHPFPPRPLLEHPLRSSSVSQT